MSLVGIFTQARPQIKAAGGSGGGLIFDAVIKESTELVTDVTEFPVENGAIGHDHAVQRPLRLSMRVGVSDNPSRALSAEASAVVGEQGVPLTRNVAGTAVGRALSELSGTSSAVAGLGASVVNAAYAAGQSMTRSQNVLDAIRDIQRAALRIDVVASKREYKNLLITSTRQETTKQNEGGLELVIEMQQLLTISDSPQRAANPAPNDPASSQAQPERDFGRVILE